MDLTLSTREVDGRTVIAVGGEVDVYTAPQHPYTRRLLDATPRLQPSGSTQEGAI